MVFEIMEKIKVAAGLNDADDVPIDLTVVADADVPTGEPPSDQEPPAKPESRSRSNGKTSKAKADVPVDVES
jgi:hypothetical protein